MPSRANVVRWRGQPGHYEVYYLTATDRATGTGIWIRYTMIAPLPAAAQPPTCALWFAAMRPDADAGGIVARKATFAIDRMRSSAQPFELRVGDATLGEDRMAGGFDDVAWDLRWTPGVHEYTHVHPMLQRLGLAKTILELPHANLAIEGTVTVGGERLELSGARGGHADRRARRRQRLHLHLARARDRQPQLVHAHRLAVPGQRRQAQAHRRGGRGS
jgi:hypothetical protein